MKKNYSIKVSLKNNPYEVLVGKNVLRKYKNKIFSTIKDAKKIFIITDTVIKRLHLRKVKQIIPKKEMVSADSYSVMNSPQPLCTGMKCSRS